MHPSISPTDISICIYSRGGGGGITYYTTRYIMSGDNNNNGGNVNGKCLVY